MKNSYPLIKFIVIILAFHHATCVAQNNSNPKLSAFTQQYIQHTNSSVTNKIKYPNVVYKKIDNVYFLSALIKVTSVLNEAHLQALNVKVGTKAGQIWTVQIPENKFNDFLLLNGIECIQLDEPIHANLDIARKTTRVDSVHR